ncbi:MAG TPA: uracil-DNA glycosylase [Telluria sp.]
MKTVSHRDSAFLAEMGIAPLWQLRQQPQAAPVEETAPVAEIAAEGAVQDPAEPDIAQMDWAALRAAIASCTRCGACRPGAKPVYGAGAESAVWLVAAGATSVADEAANLPVAGDAGMLLDNMLAAAGHARARDVYVTNLVKCRPASANGGDRAATADEVAACRPFLARELALTGAGVLLTLGQVAANAMLDQPLQAPLAGARGRVHSVDGAAMVATLHPGELLRRGADKALAWADLCRAMAAQPGDPGHDAAA